MAFKNNGRYYRIVFDKTSISEDGKTLNLTYLEYEDGEKRNYEKTESEKLKRFIKTYSGYVDAAYQKMIDFCKRNSVRKESVLTDGDGLVVDARYPELSKLQKEYSAHNSNLYQIQNHFSYAAAGIDVSFEDELVEMGFNPEWKTKNFGQTAKHSVRIEIEPGFDVSPAAQYKALKEYMVQAEDC